MCADGRLPFCANDVGKIGENRSLRAPTRANIPTSPYGLRRLRGMEHAKLATGHKLPIGQSSTSAAKKAARKEAESSRPLRKEMGSKSKSEKLVCRYCGSNDLAPRFIKRRDRRCRKCFSKRYGSAVPTKNSKSGEKSRVSKFIGMASPTWAVSTELLASQTISANIW